MLEFETNNRFESGKTNIIFILFFSSEKNLKKTWLSLLNYVQFNLLFYPMKLIVCPNFYAHCSFADSSFILIISFIKVRPCQGVLRAPTEKKKYF